MKAVALESPLHSASAKHQQKAKARPVPGAPWFFQPVSITDAQLIQRKSSCACGGGCPQCENQSKSKIRLQPKLKISTPGDQYEQEADRVAEQVMRAPSTPQEEDARGFARTEASTIQRKCGQCEEDELQKKESLATRVSDDSHDVPAMMREVFASAGQPLDAATRDFMESRFSHDFGSVRVHSDAAAAEAARSVNALAFTVGRNVVFGPDQYAPHTTLGKRLLAHELTHVVQQGATRNKLQPQTRMNRFARSSERDANRAARLSEPGAGRVSITPAPPAIQRTCGEAAIGTPAGCTAQTPVLVSGYPMIQFLIDCDDFATGEEAKLITAAGALPATSAVEVHGFASMGGDAAYNENLSCARALKANSVLTAASPGGAGLAASRIAGIFNHGATPGAGSKTRGVVLTPAATALPSAVPAAGATDFNIERVGTSNDSRIFFARGVSTLDVAAKTVIAGLRVKPPGTLRLIGYASADEAASVAQDRADEVKKALSEPATAEIPATATSPVSPAQNPVPVGSAVGDAPATAKRSDYTAVRSVEILVGAAPPTTTNCAEVDAAGILVHPPKQPCTTMDPDTWTEFNKALPVANDAMTAAVNAVTGAPSTDDAKLIDRFFGDHKASTLATLRKHLPKLQTHVSGLGAITSCGGQCDAGKCDGGTTIAYNDDVDAASTMTLCVPKFKSMHVNDRARNLIHESAHGTGGMGAPVEPSDGTKDVAYRHERMLFQLSTEDKLRNSDSYALFAMFMLETKTTKDPTAVPAGISTPASDTMPGFGKDEPALRLALAQLEKRLSWASDHVGQLYGEVVDVRGGKSWAASWGKSMMDEAARRFPLNPTSSPTTLADQTRLASIVERYLRMKMAVKRNLNLSRMATGLVRWPTTVAGDWVTGDTLQIGPDFFLATPRNQISLLLEQLAISTKDVEPAFVPAYVSFAEWIHDNA